MAEKSKKPSNKQKLFAPYDPKKGTTAGTVAGAIVMANGTVAGMNALFGQHGALGRVFVGAAGAGMIYAGHRAIQASAARK
jgi:hypothetical protein